MRVPEGCAVREGVRHVWSLGCTPGGCMCALGSTCALWSKQVSYVKKTHWVADVVRNLSISDAEMQVGMCHLAIGDLQRASECDSGTKKQKHNFGYHASFTQSLFRTIPVETSCHIADPSPPHPCPPLLPALPSLQLPSREAKARTQSQNRDARDVRDSESYKSEVKVLGRHPSV